MTDLKLDWASHEAAKYACENWHYTKKMPVNKLVKIGAWENNKFVGVVIFGVGASAVLHQQFNLDRTEVCELVRVALTKHSSPVSKIISIAFRLLKKANPKLKICVSFADPSQNHHGGIYQAGNWIFTGVSGSTTQTFYKGDWRHDTDVFKRLTSQQIKSLPRRKAPGKYRYIYCLDNSLKKDILKRAKPYPKRVKSIVADTPGFHLGEDGAEPILTLHLSNSKGRDEA